jgi:hypothetical protein
MTPTRALIEAAEDLMRDVDDLSYTANIGLPDSFDSLKAAISSAKAAEGGVETKWIYLKDRFPEKSLDVYVLARFTKEFLSAPGMYNRRPAEVVSGNCVHMNPRIYTHWSPISEPQVREKEGL